MNKNVYALPSAKRAAPRDPALGQPPANVVPFERSRQAKTRVEQERTLRQLIEFVYLAAELADELSAMQRARQLIEFVHIAAGLADDISTPHGVAP